MPDILDITSAVTSRVMGAEVSLSTYEWIGGIGTDVKYVVCPQVVVRVTRDEQIHQAYVYFDPQVWREVVTADFIADWAFSELEQVL